MVTYNQLSLADVFADCQEICNSDKILLSFLTFLTFDFSAKIAPQPMKAGALSIFSFSAFLKMDHFIDSSFDFHPLVCNFQIKV